MEHTVLAVEENLAQIRNSNWPGTPPASMQGYCCSSTPSKKKVAPTQNFLTVTMTPGQLSHTLLHSPGAQQAYAKRAPDLPAGPRHVPGCPFTGNWRQSARQWPSGIPGDC